MKQYANRTDTNHKAIMEIARCADCIVFDVSAKKNFFDLLLLRKGQTYCVEVKYAKGKLTKGEQAALAEFKKADVNYYIVRTAYDLAKVLGLSKREANKALARFTRVPLSALHNSKSYRVELREDVIKTLNKYINEL